MSPCRLEAVEIAIGRPHLRSAVRQALAQSDRYWPAGTAAAGAVQVTTLDDIRDAGIVYEGPVVVVVTDNEIADAETCVRADAYVDADRINALLASTIVLSAYGLTPLPAALLYSTGEAAARTPVPQRGRFR